VFKPENVNVVVGAGGKLETQFKYTKEQLEDINFQPRKATSCLEENVDDNYTAPKKLASSPPSKQPLPPKKVGDGKNALVDGVYTLRKDGKQYWAAAAVGVFWFACNIPDDITFSETLTEVLKEWKERIKTPISVRDLERRGFTIGLLQRTWGKDLGLQFVPGLYQKSGGSPYYFVHDGEKRYYHSVTLGGARSYYEHKSLGNAVLDPENDHVRIKDL
jgi:hypothetical protein